MVLFKKRTDPKQILHRSTDPDPTQNRKSWSLTLFSQVGQSLSLYVHDSTDRFANSLYIIIRLDRKRQTWLVNNSLSLLIFVDATRSPFYLPCPRQPAALNLLLSNWELPAGRTKQLVGWERGSDLWSSLQPPPPFSPLPQFLHYI